MGDKVETKNYRLQLVISLIGIAILMFGVILFNQNILMSLPLGVRAVLGVLLHWGPAIVPIIIMILNKEGLRELGFSKEKLGLQILIGIIIALAMSFAFTLIPILFGFKDMVGSTTYTKLWQFIYEFAYCILGVAFAEEFIFRGFIFYKLLQIKRSRKHAIIISSLLFGIYHIFSGNIIQVFMTFLIGLFLSMCREKIKNCTITSLIVAHGVYDALIVVLVAIL